MRIYPVFVPNQGCPSRCLFCAQNRTSTHASMLSVKSLASQLDAQLPKQGDGEIAFYGGTFTFLPSVLQAEFLTIAQHFIHSGRVAGIRISTRPDGLEHPQLNRLRAAGVTTIEIGCQSFDNNVLNASRRGHTAEQSIEAVHRCRSYDFSIGLQLMPGLPDANIQEGMVSLQVALNLRPDFLRIYPTVVVAGTRLAELWRIGKYQCWSLDQTVDICADLLIACRDNNVPVIRFGLQQDKALERNLLAGPYHPAFGQLVRSRIWRRAIEQTPSRVVLRVNPDDLSDVIGHRAQNRLWMQLHRPLQKVQPDILVRPGWVAVEYQSWPVEELARKVA